MGIKNKEVVNSTSKYIVKSTGVGSEKNQEMIKGGAVKLKGANSASTVSLIECYHLIEGTGTLKISAGKETKTLTGNGKYGLRPEQLKFGEDKQFKITTDKNVKSYLLVTEFRRN